MPHQGKTLIVFRLVPTCKGFSHELRAWWSSLRMHCQEQRGDPGPATGLPPGAPIWAAQSQYHPSTRRPGLWHNGCLPCHIGWCAPSWGLGLSHPPTQAIKASDTWLSLWVQNSDPFQCVCVCMCVHTPHSITHTHTLAAESQQSRQGCAFHRSLTSGWVREGTLGTQPWLSSESLKNELNQTRQWWDFFFFPISFGGGGNPPEEFFSHWF